MTDIVRDPDHSRGAPTIDGTGIRVLNVASAYEHSGYSPDENVWQQTLCRLAHTVHT